MIYKSEQELVKMTEFVERKGWETIKDSTGIMYEVVESTDGNSTLQIGDSVALSYVYSTLDGRIINKTRENDFWRIVVGDPQIRVSGLTRLLTLTKHNEKVRAVIPFAEAFGEDGYGALIPPYTTVVIEFKANKIEQK